MEDAHCKHLLGDLSEYVDGTAQAEICREIERHLAGCENCRVVVDTLKKTVFLYQPRGNPGLPSEVRERLFVRLDLQEYLGRD